MNILRIIDQTKVGAETRRNIPFEGEYEILMNKFLRADDEPEKQHDNIFRKAILNYYDFEEGQEFPFDETIVGFVYLNNMSYPIHSYEVVYIVGSEGQTIERVYGQYIKY